MVRGFSFWCYPDLNHARAAPVVPLDHLHPAIGSGLSLGHHPADGAAADAAGERCSGTIWLPAASQRGDDHGDDQRAGCVGFCYPATVRTSFRASRLAGAWLTSMYGRDGKTAPGKKAARVTGRSFSMRRPGPRASPRRGYGARPDACSLCGRCHSVIAPAARSESYVARWPAGLQAVLNWPALRRRACPGVAPRWPSPPRRRRHRLPHRHGASFAARDWRLRDASIPRRVQIVRRESFHRLSLQTTERLVRGRGGSQDPDRRRRHHPGSAKPLAWA
jgi:hypothetical protein